VPAHRAHQAIDSGLTHRGGDIRAIEQHRLQAVELIGTRPLDLDAALGREPSAMPSSTSTPDSTAARVSARYMSPVSTKFAPMALARAYPTVLFPAPDGPSIATVSVTGAPGS
jgi:hypothetical protein